MGFTDIFFYQSKMENISKRIEEQKVQIHLMDLENQRLRKICNPSPLSKKEQVKLEMIEFENKLSVFDKNWNDGIRLKTVLSLELHKFTNDDELIRVLENYILKRKIKKLQGENVWESQKM